MSEHAPQIEKQPEAPKPMEALVNKLLNDEKIKNLPEDEQGKVIVDRFIGAVVRSGTIEGRVDTYTPDFTLNLIDDLGKQGEPDYRTITSSMGYRSAALALSGDTRTAQLMGRFSEQLKTEETSTGEVEFTLTTPAQVEGYIEAGGLDNYLDTSEVVPGVNLQGDEWMPIVMEQVQRMSRDTHLTWATASEARGMMESSSPYIKNTGRDWQSALYTAEKVGVDTNMLKRSAEYIQQRVRTGESLAARAMFIVTEGRIDSYAQRLRQRSGMN